jgi:hypothetical protein
MALRSIVISHPGEDRIFSLREPNRAQVLFAAPVTASFDARDKTVVPPGD